MQISEPISGVPEPVSFVPPRFGIEDEEGLQYLEEHGYVVFKDILTPEQVEQGRSLAWDFLEGLENAGVKRDDPNTWGGFPDRYHNGVVVEAGVGHCSLLWFLRGLPKVQLVYQKIWRTEELITSYDGFCMHRPFEYNPAWHTKTGWYHLDQNGRNKPRKICVQGFVNFYDSDEEDGGLVVVPDSCKIFNAIFKNHPQLGSGRSDFIPLTKTGPHSVWEREIKEAGLHPIKVCCKAGDMVLWDSRTIHCNTHATRARPLPTDGSILPPRRLVAYVCMTPASRLTPRLVKERQQAFLQGDTTSHWPEDCRVAGRKNWATNYKPPNLPPAALKLIPMGPGVSVSVGTADNDIDTNSDIQVASSSSSSSGTQKGQPRGRGGRGKGKPRNQRISNQKKSPPTN